MIEHPVTFDLPKPWDAQPFTIDRFGDLSFFVGPNGSGKSRFADNLKNALPNARMLGTDRLEGMSGTMRSVYGDHFSAGFQKNQFSAFRQMGNQGSGIDAFVILENRPDIRIIVEATLSSLFNRDIMLEWDSGNLVPTARLARTGDTYRVDREECHGIRELLVLLTHLHNDQHPFLIIDEPELNLHPQFQSFFMQEARQIAGTHVPGTSRKGVLLITHSPFIVDLRSMDDMQSVFCFSADHAPPTSIGWALQDAERSRFVSLIPRLNVHHKQLFFADHPIFVEGISDVQFVEAIQERRKSSITAAGSCLIDVGGCEEATKYVELCHRYRKKAYFLFDLDSLFLGSLRKCLRADGGISEFLASVGLGADFSGYRGALDRELTTAVRAIEAVSDAQGVVAALQSYFQSLAEDPNKLARQRVAVLIELASNRASVLPLLTERLVIDIEGRLQQIQAALKTKRIFLLGGGALEHYLPSYAGNRYALNDSSKKVAVAAEIALLMTGAFDGRLADRYGELYSCIAELPAKPPVDTESVLRGYVSEYIHDLQGIVITKPGWSEQQINAHFATSQAGFAKLIAVAEFKRTGNSEFKAVLKIAGSVARLVDVSHETNAGMRRFTFREAAPAAGA